MRIQTSHLKRAGQLTRTVDEGTGLTIVYGEGGGCTLDVAGGGFTATWIPLRGALQVQCAGLNWSLAKGDVLMTEFDTVAKAVGRGSARWLALLAGKQAWEQGLSSPSATHSQLLPNLYRADHELRHLAVAVARASNSMALDGSVNALMDKVASMQETLQQAVARCPGRTWLNKRQVFLRLQRVHNYMCAYSDQPLDIDTLARMANYSPCHFLRIFHMVYQTTPHAYLLERRLKRAWELLRSSNMAVTEVAMACGFENRSAFSRLFREHFGTTAQETKRRGRSYALPVIDLAAA